MPSPPAIFDHALLRRRRARAGEGADFLFREVAEGIAGRLDVIKKEFPVALDLGSASGALSEALRARPGTRAVISADRSPAAPGVDVVCDPERLPFAPGSFDAVASCLDLHWANDLPGALMQIRRILKPDGLFLGALAGGETLFELRAALMEAELAVTGGASPRVSPFASLHDMAALMQRAGFALPVVDAERITVEYPDMFRLMRDLRAMGAANATFNRLKKPTRRAVFTRAAQIYAQKHADPATGRIPATFEIIHVIGWAPHESQPKPLKRGEGKVSLVQVLGPSSASGD